MFKIEKVWVFVAIDENGNEGVCAAAIGPNRSWVPLIAADQSRMTALLPVAQEIADQTGVPIKVITMSTREEVMEIGDVRKATH